MLKVIIADDEKRICQLLKVLVDWEKLGFQIVGMEHDGKSLLKAVHECRPDVVVTDIRMPGCSGLELLHAIREDRLDVEVLIMSGYRQFEYVQTALREGASDYILKPLRRDVVEEALLKIRERRVSAEEQQKKLNHIQKTLEDYSRYLKEDLLEKILDGRVKHATLDELNQTYQCGFSDPYVYFATLKIDMSGTEAEGFHDKAEEVMKQKFRTISETEFRKNDIVSLCRIKENYVYILANVSDKHALEHSLYRLIYAMKEYLIQLRNGHITAGISLVENGELFAAMQQSRAAVLDQLYRGYDRVLDYQPHPDDSASEGAWGSRKAQELREVFQSFSNDRVFMIVQGFLEDIREAGQRTQSGELVVQRMNWLQKVLMDSVHGILPQEELEELLGRYQKQLDRCCEWNAYIKLFQSEIGELIRQIENERSKKEKKPIRLMKQIMEEHYAEPLTLEMLAQRLEMSSTYVSRLFSKETGVSFSQYLTTIRMDKAKALLTHTNETAAQIAAKIGYNDEKYFLRIFKREVGLTTGEYRRLYGE